MSNIAELSRIRERLETLDGPDPELERSIIILLGFTRTVVDKVVEGKPVKRVMWVPPGGGDPIPEPRCTSSLEDAVKFAKILAPGAKCGFSWEPGLASAKIGDGMYWQARTPHAAICLAVLDDFIIKNNTTVQ